MTDLLNNVMDPRHNDDNGSDKEDAPDIANIRLNKKETLYFKQVDRFFKKLDDKKISKMIDIINCEHKISLRILDWFITHYSELHTISYMLPDEFEEGEGDLFNVHIGYKAQLKAYTKKYFDPFRRRKKVKFTYNINCNGVNHQVVTTLCQLNFFKWVFSNLILEYVENHYKEIVDEMAIFNRERNRQKKVTQSPDSQSSKSTIAVETKIVKGVQITGKQKRTTDKNRELKIVLSFDD